MERLARSELAEPVARIAAAVLVTLDELVGAADSPLWRRAISATRALATAPQHRLRSQLVLLGDLAGGGAGAGEAVEDLAAGLELLHLFMLVHDDVIDGAVLRRGQPSVHSALAAESPALGRDDARNLAIVIGNLLHVLGMERIVRSDPHGVATRVILDANRRTGVGQFEDVVGWRGWSGRTGSGDPGAAPGNPTGSSMGSSTIDRAGFRAIMEDKSAYQSFAAPLAAGLLRANPRGDAGPALSWGRRMGVALQALDDLTDLIGDPNDTGKDNFRDLIEGRLSLAVLVLLERTSGEDRKLLAGLRGARVIMPSDRRALDEMIAKYDVVAACREFITEEIAAARTIGDGAGLPTAARAALSAIEAGLLEMVGRVG